MPIFRLFLTGTALLMALASCSGPSTEVQVDAYPQIFPDYVGVTVPATMAELRFEMADGSRCRITRRTEDGVQWVSVKAWQKGSDVAQCYKPFPIYLCEDEIDPYIAYRLIEPGYESWHDISICQRELSSYKESAVLTNRAVNDGCINCHTFNSGDPQDMIFHARGAGGGTVFYRNGEARILNLATVGPHKQGTYPTWHPEGRYVAFSSNTTHQCFSITDAQPIEVYDTASDIILMDLQTDSIYTFPALCGDEVLETFPAWSEDGHSLYYCAAENPGDIVKNRPEIHYSLKRIGFEDGKFVGDPETVWACDSASVSFPRVKDGKILFTRSDFGTFPIWHAEADLWILDTATGEAREAEELNSPDTESYHSWSSNGKWVVFSSRRLDGRYTRLYIAHYEGEGHFSKPFLLPQKDPQLNVLRVKSYNLPEFVRGEIPSAQKSVSKLFAR